MAEEISITNWIHRTNSDYGNGKMKFKALITKIAKEMSEEPGIIVPTVKGESLVFEFVGRSYSVEFNFGPSAKDSSNWLSSLSMMEVKDDEEKTPLSSLEYDHQGTITESIAEGDRGLRIEVLTPALATKVFYLLFTKAFQNPMPR
jgi:hypothetical protein